MAKDVKAASAKAKTEPQERSSRNVAPEAVKKKRQYKALIKLAIYSALMFCMPFAIFVANAYTYLDPLYEVTIGIPSPNKRSIVGGILAVIVSNIVVALFVLTAFNDEDAVEVKQD